LLKRILGGAGEEIDSKKAMRGIEDIDEEDDEDEDVDMG